MNNLEGKLTEIIFYEQIDLGPGLNGSYDTSTFTISIQGNGDLYFSPWKDYKENVKNLIIGEGIKTIGSSAFNYSIGLISVLIKPNSTLTTIRYDAFLQCISLQSIDLPSSVTTIELCAFSHCISLKSINIPLGVCTIMIGLFTGCRSLNSIIIPPNVTKIESSAFYQCINLESITLPSCVSTIGSGVFEGCIKLNSLTLPSFLKIIPSRIFYNCTCLGSITIPSNVSTIEMRSFSYCSNLNTVIIGGNIRTIDMFAFSYCRNLQLIEYCGFTSPAGPKDIFFGASFPKIHVSIQYQGNFFIDKSVRKDLNENCTIIIFTKTIEFSSNKERSPLFLIVFQKLLLPVIILGN